MPANALTVSLAETPVDARGVDDDDLARLATSSFGLASGPMLQFAGVFRLDSVDAALAQC
jgi:hypothetical protein